MADRYMEALREYFEGNGIEWTKRIPGESDYDWPEDVRVAWQHDGTALVEGSRTRKEYGRYRVTVLVEPAESWEQRTWKEVEELSALAEANSDQRPLYVELGGVRAQVLSAALSRWHVKPGTGDARWNPPVRMEHDVVTVRLQVDGAPESKVYEMPPNGVVMLLTGSPVGPAVAALASEFSMEVIPSKGESK